ncbi:hypothetical protein Hanom_Chr11g01062431 [Helianthus anomalus]
MIFNILCRWQKYPSPRYTQNRKHLRRVYPIPDGYWGGYGYVKFIFHAYGTSMRLDDTRTNYPKLYSRLPDIYIPGNFKV